MSKPSREFIEAVTRELTDRGLLIEAGYAGLRLYAMPSDAPQVQIDECRMYFMAGAQHLFSSIMGILDPGIEPTDTDMRRMTLIDNELREFAKELLLRVTKPEGHG